MAKYKYTALGTFTTAIGGDSTTPTLKSLASGSRVTGNEIDNTSGKNILSNWQLKIKFAGGAMPVDVYSFDLFFVKCIDGTNYEYGSDTVQPPPSSFVCHFQATNTNSTTQIIEMKNITLPNCKFKPLIVNRTGKSLSGVDNDNILSYEVVNIESV